MTHCQLILLVSTWPSSLTSLQKTRWQPTVCHPPRSHDLHKRTRKVVQVFRIITSALAPSLVTHVPDWLEQQAAEQSQWQWCECQAFDLSRLTVGRRHRRPGIAWRWTLGLWRMILQNYNRAFNLSNLRRHAHQLISGDPPDNYGSRQSLQDHHTGHLRRYKSNNPERILESSSTWRRIITALCWFLTLQVRVGSQISLTVGNIIGDHGRRQ